MSLRRLSAANFLHINYHHSLPPAHLDRTPHLKAWRCHRALFSTTRRLGLFKMESLYHQCSQDLSFLLLDHSTQLVPHLHIPGMVPSKTDRLCPPRKAITTLVL